jgi:Mg-chelatase subunit ChlD
MWLIACGVLCGGAVNLRGHQQQQPHPAAETQRPRRVSTGQAVTTNALASNLNNAPREKGAQEEVDEGETVLRVETQLVSVPVSVINNQGHPVSKLTAENFLLYEDGQRQRIAEFASIEAPFDIALLLDTSGSTRAETALIRRAAFAFLDLMRPGDRVAVVAFRNVSDGMAGRPLTAVDVKTHLTNNPGALRTAIEEIETSVSSH